MFRIENLNGNSPWVDPANDKRIHVEKETIENNGENLVLSQKVLYERVSNNNNNNNKLNNRSIMLMMMIAMVVVVVQRVADDVDDK